MVFSSFEFLCIFLPVLCIVYAILPSMRWKNGLLIIGSLLFYAYGEPIYVLLMIGSSLVHYLLAMGISKSASAKKPLLALDVKQIYSTMWGCLPAAFMFTEVEVLYNGFLLFTKCSQIFSTQHLTWLIIGVILHLEQRRGHKEIRR